VQAHEVARPAATITDQWFLRSGIRTSLSTIRLQVAPYLVR
jgi:hypothetical protein